MSYSIIHHIKTFLSSKRVSLAIVLVAMVSRVIQLIYFFNIRVDGSFQVMATKNLLNGHGVTLDKVLPGDVSHIIYEPLINWPPGYSLLLAPFYLVTGNYISACLFVDIIFAWLLILVSRKILKLLDVPIHLVNIYTFITGFFLYYFYVIASTDAIGISLFMSALYLGLRFLKGEKITGSRLFLFCVLLVALAFLKYLFIPVAFVIPLFLLVYAWKNHQKKIFRAAKVSIAILLVAIAALLFYQKYVSGAATYISSPERGFYPEHLADAYPFIPAAIVQPESIRGVITGMHSYQLIFAAYQVIQWILLIVFCFYLVVFLIRSKWKSISPVQSYFILSWGVSVVITVMLLILSLTVAKEELIPGLFWTYLEEARYYGLPVVLLHGAIFIAAKKFRTGIRPWKYIPYIFIVLLFAEAMRGLGFDVRRVFIGKEEFSWQYEKRFQEYADNLIQKKKKESGAVHVVVTASSYMNSRVSLYSHVPILYPVEQVNDMAAIRTSQPVLLVVILDEQKKNRFLPFLSNREAAGQFDQFTFYTAYIEPHR